MCNSKQTRKRDSQAELVEEPLREVITAGEFSGDRPPAIGAAPEAERCAPVRFATL